MAVFPSAGADLPPPFIIWTLQRTGGTTLAHLLMQLAGGPTLGHEPFNIDRLFGHLTRSWLETGDDAALQGAIRAGLSPPGTMKHCFEILPLALSEQLLEISTTAGYRHLILDRRSEADRILSLLAARLTGAWGPEAAGRIYARIETGDECLPEADAAEALQLARHSRHCREGLARAFRSRGLAPEVLIFEDLYSRPEAGAAEVRRAARALGMDPGAIPDFDARTDQALRSGGQNSPRILTRLPNAEALRRALLDHPAAQPFDWAAAL